MAKYRISVSFDEKNFFWIITQDGRIINRSPTKEALIDAKNYLHGKSIL